MYGIEKNNNNIGVSQNIKGIENIDLIEWAFAKGYKLGHIDTKQGVHINFSELIKSFLNELTDVYAQDKNSEI